jgi:hypothetical protein
LELFGKHAKSGFLGCFAPLRQELCQIGNWCKMVKNASKTYQKLKNIAKNEEKCAKTHLC